MQSVEFVKVYFSACYVVLALFLGYGLILLGRRLIRPANFIHTSPL